MFFLSTGLLPALAPVSLDACCALTKFCDWEGGLALGDPEFDCCAPFPELSTRLAPTEEISLLPSPDQSRATAAPCPVQLPGHPAVPGTRVQNPIRLSFPSSRPSALNPHPSSLWLRIMGRLWLLPSSAQSSRPVNSSFKIVCFNVLHSFPTSGYSVTSGGFCHGTFLFLFYFLIYF